MLKSVTTFAEQPGRGDGAISACESDHAANDTFCPSHEARPNQQEERPRPAAPFGSTPLKSWPDGSRESRMGAAGVETIGPPTNERDGHGPAKYPRPPDSPAPKKIFFSAPGPARCSFRPVPIRMHLDGAPSSAPRKP